MGRRACLPFVLSDESDWAVRVRTRQACSTPKNGLGETIGNNCDAPTAEFSSSCKLLSAQDVFGMSIALLMHGSRAGDDQPADLSTLDSSISSEPSYGLAITCSDR